MRKFLNGVKLFFKGAVAEGATEKLEKRAHYLNLDLLSVVLSHELGIPNPLFYHTVELLPYLAPQLEVWRRSEKETILGRALGECGEP
ncbi:hypothetical protein [Thermovibrio ammonificans]|uniref:Uncharacterized protein n=1 Tax=Thermovibrio ammonificans (strain DSM 15698 / JCM 12110 / HB-1) TaxID=648996 RepID=E8T5Q9_THEA1|nr:hypothetical protein [Thermovibrio ammonificans]ADU96534.1 hypothetical protein Theam_0562 [Thermovibrio ammonificans HB-1]